MSTREAKVREHLIKIGKHEGVECVVLADESGFPLSSTISPEKAETISALTTSLLGKVHVILKELNIEGLQAFTIKAANKEILVTPFQDTTLVVVRKNGGS
ncbi:MAG: roadblock/LC7 domain-containing protein [Candidatus Ranarchaeia archaeon]|jgi:predicted regulator of Ras-like GTPase activity (Roadblock/LC7/MglB family)